MILHRGTPATKISAFSPEDNLESFKVATLARYFLEESETLVINARAPRASHTAVSQMDDLAVLPLTNGSI